MADRLMLGHEQAAVPELMRLDTDETKRVRLGLVDTLGERILHHLNITAERELRDERGIANVLSEDVDVIRIAMTLLESEGWIRRDPRRDGLETWRTDDTPDVIEALNWKPPS